MERQLIKRGLDRLILLPITLSVVYAGVLLWQLNRMIGQTEWVQHTSEILTVASDAERHIQFQESALRGYLLDHSPIFRQQFTLENATIDSIFQQAHQLVRDNPVQMRRLDTLLQVYWNWQASATNSIAVAGQNMVDTSVMTRAMLAVTMRSIFLRANAEERSLHEQRLSRFRWSTSWLTASIAALSIILGIVVGLHARRQTKRFINRFTHNLDDTARNRDLLETTLLSIGDAIIVTGADQKIMLMNRRAEELTGWSKEEARNRAVNEVFRIVGEVARSRVESPIASVLRERRTVELANHTVLLSRTGVDYPIEDSAAPIHNSRGEIVGVVLVFRDVSQRREDEREAAQRAREFRALIENSPDIITRYNRDFTITYANPAIEQFLGISPQALIGRRYKEVGIPEVAYTQWERDVNEVFDTGRNLTTEIQYQSVRGLRSYQARVVPEMGNNRVESVISIARDITEMKQTEARLSESEQRFRSIVESSPDAFYLMRAVREGKKDDRNAPKEIVDFVFEYINAQGAALVTIPPEQLLGKRLTEAFTGERATLLLERYAEVVERGIPTYEDYRAQSRFVKDAAGAPFEESRQWLHSQYLPIGEMLAITTSDITSRMNVDRALRQSEERYRRLVENASEAIFSTGKEGYFTYANPYIRELGGFGDEDVTKYFFTDLVVPSHKNQVKRHFFRQFLSRSPDSYIEAPFTAKDGSEKWLAITTSLRLHGEEVDGFDCVAADVTERRRIESEVRDARTHESGNASEERRQLTELLRDPLTNILEVSRGLAGGYTGISVDEAATQIALHAERALAALD